MGNSIGIADLSFISKGKYVAKETFWPSEMAFYDFPLLNDGPNAAKQEHELEILNPLRINEGDNLKLLTDEMFVGTDGTRLYKMENMKTREVGLVIADLVEESKNLDVNDHLSLQG
jgi:hypothetical protein